MRNVTHGLILLLILISISILLPNFLKNKYCLEELYSSEKLAFDNTNRIFNFIFLGMFVVLLFFSSYFIFKNIYYSFFVVLLSFTFPIFYFIGANNFIFLGALFCFGAIFSLMYFIYFNDKLNKKIKICLIILFVCFSVLSIYIDLGFSLILFFFIFYKITFREIFKKHDRILVFISLIIILLISCWFAIVDNAVYLIIFYLISVVSIFLKSREKYVCSFIVFSIFLLIIYIFHMFNLTVFSWEKPLKIEELSYLIYYITLIGISLILSKELKLTDIMFFVMVFPFLGIISFKFFLFSVMFVAFILSILVKSLLKNKHYVIILTIIFITLNFTLYNFVKIERGDKIIKIKLPTQFKNKTIYSSIKTCISLKYYNPDFNIVCLKDISLSKIKTQLKGKYVVLSYYYDVKRNFVFDVLIPKFCKKTICNYISIYSHQEYEWNGYTLTKLILPEKQSIYCYGSPQQVLWLSKIYTPQCYVKIPGAFIGILLTSEESKLFIGLNQNNLTVKYIGYPNIIDEGLSDWFIIVEQQ